MEPDWKAAYNILMDYWECIPEEERHIVDQKLRLVLDEDSMGVQKGCNSPFKPLSQDSDSVPKDCMKRALERLKDEFGFGEPKKVALHLK